MLNEVSLVASIFSPLQIWLGFWFFYLQPEDYSQRLFRSHRTSRIFSHKIWSRTRVCRSWARDECGLVGSKAFWWGRRVLDARGWCSVSRGEEQQHWINTKAYIQVRAMMAPQLAP
jgi:hypothetical protein